MSGGDTITDAVIGGAAEDAVGDAVGASKRKKKQHFSMFQSPTAAGECSNCGTKLSGPVCHSCGQTSDTFHRPIWDLFMDVVDGLLGLEGRLWRTLPALMFRPGAVTKSYLTGQRARYVMPFRLYLTASVLFFLAFSLVNSGGGGDTTDVEPPDAAAAIEGQQAGLEAARANVQFLPPEVRDEVIAGLNEADADLLEAAENADEPLTPEMRELRAAQGREESKLAIRRALLPEDFPDVEPGTEDDPQLVDAGGMTLSFGDVSGAPYWLRARLANGADRIIDTQGQALWTEMKTWAPRLIFFLLPIYALFLAGTHFYKKGLFFYDHLVVSLHFHAFLFFQFLLLGVISLAIGPGWAILAFFLWSNYYLYRIHRSVYEHGRISSAMRTVFLDFIYMIVLSFGFMILFFVGVFNAGS
ncbi:DUF3667 domain-containing protein [Maricaulis alexandrii]|uniref:DUF3667 domain-containing protein n=1 Tax=Maricaulis alexandrii TaxID=2570354 RepID=UPI001108D296|nr:DUF3667 domain-containing protein [Maricaulis alexandrii]